MAKPMLCDRCGREKPDFIMRKAPNGQVVCPICIADGRGDDCKDAAAIGTSVARTHDGISYA